MVYLEDWYFPMITSLWGLLTLPSKGVVNVVSAFQLNFIKYIYGALRGRFMCLTKNSNWGFLPKDQNSCLTDLENNFYVVSFQNVSEFGKHNFLVE